MPITVRRRGTAPTSQGPSTLRRVLAGAARVGSGVLATPVGAVPSPFTTSAAFGIGALGELLAEGIEGSDPNFRRAMLEGGLAAVPFGKLIKGGRALESAARSGVLSGAGELGRQYTMDQEMDLGTAAVTGGLGALTGGVLGKFTRPVLKGGSAVQAGPTSSPYDRESSLAKLLGMKNPKEIEDFALRMGSRGKTDIEEMTRRLAVETPKVSRETIKAHTRAQEAAAARKTAEAGIQDIEDLGLAEQPSVVRQVFKTGTKTGTRTWSNKPAKAEDAESFYDLVKGGAGGKPPTSPITPSRAAESGESGVLARFLRTPEDRARFAEARELVSKTLVDRGEDPGPVMKQLDDLWAGYDIAAPENIKRAAGANLSELRKMHGLPRTPFTTMGKGGGQGGGRLGPSEPPVTPQGPSGADADKAQAEILAQWNREQMGLGGKLTQPKGTPLPPGVALPQLKAPRSTLQPPPKASPPRAAVAPKAVTPAPKVAPTSASLARNPVTLAMDIINTMPEGPRKAAMLAKIQQPAAAGPAITPTPATVVGKVTGTPPAKINPNPQGSAQIQDVLYAMEQNGNAEAGAVRVALAAGEIDAREGLYRLRVLQQGAPKVEAPAAPPPTVDKNAFDPTPRLRTPGKPDTTAIAAMSKLKTLGYDFGDIGRMTREEAAEIVASGITKPKGGTTLGSGFGGLQGMLDIVNRNPELAARLALGSTGAVIGGVTDPLDDPLSSSIAGFAAGSALPNIVNMLGQFGVPREAMATIGEKIKSPEGVIDVVKSIGRQLPQVQRFNYLADSTGIPANVFVGPYMSGVMGTLTKALSGDPRGRSAIKELANPASFLREFRQSKEEAVRLMHSRGAERAETDILDATASGPMQDILTTPGQWMTMGDVSIRRILERHGFSEDEARVMTLTGNPELPAAKNLVNLVKTSPLLQMLSPFTRTPANIMEQGVQRIPGLGSVVQSMRKIPDVGREQVVQQGLGAAVGGVGYAAGSEMDPETARVARRYLTNASGQYSLPMSLGLAAGQANQEGRPILSGRTAFAINQALPLPTAEPISDAITAAGGGQIPRGWMPADLHRMLYPPPPRSLRPIQVRRRNPNG